MNKIHRNIWSAAKQSWVAASETAKGMGKGGATATCGAYAWSGGRVEITGGAINAKGAISFLRRSRSCYEATTGRFFRVALTRTR